LKQLLAHPDANIRKAVDEALTKLGQQSLVDERRALEGKIRALIAKMAPEGEYLITYNHILSAIRLHESGNSFDAVYHPKTERQITRIVRSLYPLSHSDSIQLGMGEIEYEDGFDLEVLPAKLEIKSRPHERN
jgi:hypothetical protein